MEIIKQINTKGEIQQMTRYQQFKKDYEIGEFSTGFCIDEEGNECLEPHLEDMKFVGKLLIEKADRKIENLSE